MSAMPAPLLWLLLAPPALGLLAGWRSPRRARWVLLVGLTAPLVAFWLVSASATAPLAGTLALGTLELHWRLNGLTALLWLLTHILLLSSALYAVGDLRASNMNTPATPGFWPLLGGLALGLGLVWIAGDLILLYLGLELTGLCALALMPRPGRVDALIASLRYLLFALIGSLAWLLGVALLLGAWGRIDLAGLAAVAEPDSVTRIAMALLTSGLLLKAAIFPLHAWLIPVHGSAWTPVSAVHAALVVKVSFFILLLLWRLLLPDAVVGAWALGVLGSLAVLWGGIQAWRAAGLKHLVAWSTLAQLGYLMLAFPLLARASAEVATLAWQATWLQLGAHALAKAALFMAAGNLLLSTGAARIEGLIGSSRRLPLSLMTFGLAALTLMGLPPSAGFTAKWLLLQAAFASGQWIWALVLAVGTLLTATYVFRVLRCSLVEDAPETPLRRLPLGMELIGLTLALGAIGLGLAAELPLALVRGSTLP